MATQTKRPSLFSTGSTPAQLSGMTTSPKTSPNTAVSVAKPSNTVSSQVARQMYNYSDGTQSSVSPQARQQLQQAFNQSYWGGGSYTTNTAQSDLQYKQAAQQIQQQYQNQPLTTQTYNQQFNVKNPNTNVAPTVAPPQTAKPPVPNEPWVGQPGTTPTTPGKAAPAQAPVYNAPTGTSPSAKPTPPNEPWVGQPQTQGQTQGQTQQEGQQFYLGAGQFGNVNDQTRGDIYQRTYGDAGIEPNVQGAITRLGENEQYRATGNWAASSDSETRARELLRKSGGTGTGNPQWEAFAAQDPNAAKAAWDWWNNDRTSIDAQANADRIKTDLENTISDTNPDGDVKTLADQNDEDGIVKDFKKTAGIKSEFDLTMFLDALDAKVGAQLDYAQAEVKSAAEQIKDLNDQKAIVNADYQKIQDLLVAKEVGDQQKLDLQKQDLDMETARLKEKDLGLIAVSQAMRGVSGVTTSYARQEIFNRVDNINRDYSVSLDKINLNKRQVRVELQQALAGLEKDKHDIVKDYVFKIGEYRTAMNMASPKAKVAIADLKYKASQDIEDIKTKQQSLKINAMDAQSRLNESEARIKEAYIQKMLDMSKGVGYSIGLSEYGIPDGTPYTDGKTTKGSVAVSGEIADLADQARSGGVTEDFLAPLTSRMNIYGAQETSGEREKYLSTVEQTKKLAQISQNPNLSPEEKKVESLLSMVNYVKNNTNVSVEERKTMLQREGMLSAYTGIASSIEQVKEAMRKAGYSEEDLSEGINNIAGVVLKGQATEGVIGNAIADALKGTVDKEVLSSMANMFNKLERVFGVERHALFGASLTENEAAYASRVFPMNAAAPLEYIEQQVGNFYDSAISNYNWDMNSRLNMNSKEWALAQIMRGTKDQPLSGFNQSATDTKLAPAAPSTGTKDDVQARTSFEKKYLSGNSGFSLLPSAKASDELPQTLTSKMQDGDKSGMWCGSFVNKVLNLPAGNRFGDSISQKKSFANTPINKKTTINDIIPGMAFVSNPANNSIGHVGLIENVSPEGEITIVDSNYNNDKRIRRVTYPSLEDFMKSESVLKLHNPYKNNK